MHMSAELFKDMTAIEMVHVPYRGSSAVYPDLITGKVQVFFDNLPGVIELVRSGQLHALAVTTATRSEALPDVPTIAETVSGYEASTWCGMSGPKETPIKARDLGGTPMPMSPTEFCELVTGETKNGLAWSTLPASSQ